MVLNFPRYTAGKLSHPHLEPRAASAEARLRVDANTTARLREAHGNVTRLQAGATLLADRCGADVTCGALQLPACVADDDASPPLAQYQSAWGTLDVWGPTPDTQHRPALGPAQPCLLGQFLGLAGYDADATSTVLGASGASSAGGGSYAYPGPLATAPDATQTLGAGHVAAGGGSVGVAVGLLVGGIALVTGTTMLLWQVRAKRRARAAKTEQFGLRVRRTVEQRREAKRHSRA